MYARPQDPVRGGKGYCEGRVGWNIDGQGWRGAGGGGLEGGAIIAPRRTAHVEELRNSSFGTTTGLTIELHLRKPDLHVVGEERQANLMVYMLFETRGGAVSTVKKKEAGVPPSVGEAMAITLNV